MDNNVIYNDVYKIKKEDIKAVCDEIIDKLYSNRKDKLDQNNYIAVFMQAHDILFNDNTFKIGNNKNNKLDINKLCYVYELYIYLCTVYNIIPMIEHYCYLVGINKLSIYNIRDKNLLSDKNVNLYKSLVDNTQNFVEGRLLSSSNITGAIAYANNHFYNGGPAASTVNISITGADLKKLMPKVEELPKKE